MSKPHDPNLTASDPAVSADALRPADLLSINDPAANTGGDEPSALSGLAPVSAGRYILGEEIARGGMGVVYRATDTVLSREVAVKVLQAKYGPDSGAARRFAEEARITGQLQHPAIPPVHDLGTLPDGRPFLAMKLIRGQTLEQLLKGRADLAADRGRFLAAFEQLCQAIAYAHAHNVLHRDLKPANVMVGSFGEVQVMDWGLAKVLASRERERPEADPDETTAGTQVVGLRDSDEQFTQAGSVLGTPAFMPPEQAVGAVGKIDARSDVFGLGAILAVILTGKPPFSGGSVETTRVQAAQGKVTECFARLDECGAHPDLVALCKRCLSPEKDDRPADAGEVAKEVAQLRAAADERARQAELDRVRLEGEQATAETRAAERHKRRRLWLASAGVVALAVVGGLAAVLAVQRRANADLQAANEEVTQANRELQASNEREAQRFGLAMDAIKVFHGEVSEDLLLKEKKFEGLRTKLLRGAADFYRKLEGQLKDQNDPKSREALAVAYETLADLMDKIGSKADTLAMHQQALAVRRDLASRLEAGDAEKLNVTNGLVKVGWALEDTGDLKGALSRYQEAAALAETVPASVAARAVLGKCQRNIGDALRLLGRFDEARVEYDNALATIQQLIDAEPTNVSHLQSMAVTLNNYAVGLAQIRAGESVAMHERALSFYQRVLDSHPSNPDYKLKVARSHLNRAMALGLAGMPSDAVLAVLEKARVILQPLTEEYPAVTNYQYELGTVEGYMGHELDARARKPAEAMAAYARARDIFQNLVDAHPDVPTYREHLAINIQNVGFYFQQAGKPTEALAAYEKAQAIFQGLAESNRWTDLQDNLLRSTNLVGNMLQLTGRFEEAVAAFRKALQVQEALAKRYPAADRYRNGVASAKLKLTQAERLRDLLPRLPDILAGRGQPKTPAESCELARLCTQPSQKRYADAVRLFEKAFAAEPKLADDLRSEHRYSAAGSAALSAAGQGEDADKLADKERMRLRKQALDWLRADLALYTTQLQSGKPADRAVVQQKMRHWQQDASLTGIRDAAALAKLPADEQKAFTQLWADVAALLKKAQQKQQ